MLGGLIHRGFSAGKEGGSPVIQSLSVTQNGRYEAPEGVDGFNPVIVNVPDRYDEGYDEGYEQGYSDGKKIYENLYDHEKGTLPSVTDDMGNVIDNAIVANNDNELQDYLTSTAFISNGDSVNVVGLGGDTEFTVYRSDEYDSGTGVYGATMGIKIRNRITGDEHIFEGSWAAMEDEPSAIKMKVDQLYFYDNYEAVGMWYSFELPDGRIFSGNAGGRADAVGGTKFINTSTSSDWIYS